MGSFFIAAAIYLSLLSYLLAVVCWVTDRRGNGYRRLWTAGCLLLWLHALCAFHFYHNWSHADAVALTARQTQEVLGWSYGNGIWFSYLLLVLWAIDVIQLWCRPAEEQRIGWSYFSCGVHAYAFFILFNGTVVFESGVIRWAGVIGTLWLFRLSWQHWRMVSRARAMELRS